MNFDTWKNLPPVFGMARRLGFDIRRCADWADYTQCFIRANDRDGHLVHAARQTAASLSTGEIPVLQAMLAAADFAWLADELGQNRTWDRLDRTHGEHSKAVAIAILRQ
jgi:hypothetical protein